MRSTVLMISLFCVGVAGCASIVSGVNQPISVETKLNGEPVLGAMCKLSSNKGTWFVTSPGSLTVHRGFQDLVVECAKPGMNPSTDSVASNVRALYFGNIIFGGVIGLAVDAGDGAGFDYPDLISIDMGRSVPTGAPSSTDAKPITSASSAVMETTKASTAAGIAAPAAIPAGSVAVTPQSVPAVASTAVASAPTKTSYKYMIAAESYVRNRGTCSARPRAVLAATGPGYETYAISCDSGESLIARCDYGHCHLLQ